MEIFNQYVELFTIDIDLSKLKLDEPREKLTMKQKKIERIHQRIQRNKLREDAFNEVINVADIFNDNPDLRLIREPFRY